jgi:CRISPR/Cas system CSM-associated protein Csm3 (group 7 of RAMP superfamily)
MSSDNKIKGKIVLHGQIECLSPIHVGNGRDEHSDLDIIRDAEGKPIIPATGFIGILRHACEERFSEQFDLTSFINFWGYAKNQEGQQSALCCSDLTLVENASPDIATRDGICINNEKGIVKSGGKFDFELLEAGSRFDFKLEFTLREKDEAFVKQTARTIYDLLAEGRIRLGAKTNSGLGHIRLVENETKLYCFDFSQKADVRNWLTQNFSRQPTIAAAEFGAPFSARERRFSITATLRLKNSLIVRSYSRKPEMSDTTQLMSGEDWVIPGSSLKGAIRARAERIANTMLDEKKAQEIVRELFGYPKEEFSKNKKPQQERANNATDEPDLKDAKRGRVRVQEITLTPNDFPAELQTRIRVDRFTGGVIEGGLFDSMPIFAPKEDKTMTLRLEIDDYKEHEAGLLLLVLKDLWNGDLAIGGEKNIGRGVFEGVRAEIAWINEKIIIEKNIVALKESEKATLQRFVAALVGGQV